MGMWVIASLMHCMHTSGCFCYTHIFIPVKKPNLLDWGNEIPKNHEGNITSRTLIPATSRVCALNHGVVRYYLEAVWTLPPPPSQVGVLNIRPVGWLWLDIALHVAHRNIVVSLNCLRKLVGFSIMCYIKYNKILYKWIRKPLPVASVSY